MLAALRPHDGAYKVVSREAAAELVERWRRVGWRAGFVFGAFEGGGPEMEELLDRARGACDRLTVGLAPDQDGGEQEAIRAARLAALPSVDLVVSSGVEPTAELLRALRPELLIEATAPEGRNLNAELVREWGGRVLPAAGAPLPEPAI